MSSRDDMIEGVAIKEPVTHADEPGFFRHIHKVQTDWWYVASGVLKVGLHDTRPDSPTYRVTDTLLMGDHQKPIVLRIPPGVAHGCRVIGGPVNLFYVTSHVYDPNDEGRIPHDDPEIGFDWTAAPPIT